MPDTVRTFYCHVQACEIQHQIHQMFPASSGASPNYVQTRVPLPGLTADRHKLKILGLDLGVVIDRVTLP
jgi:hypothetical protein